MNEEILLNLIFCATLLLLGLWGAISFSLFYRRIRGTKLRQIESVFADLVSRHLYGRANAEINFLNIQRSFRKIGITEKNPHNVQYLIDLMLRTQRCLLGENHEKIGKLYDQIPPYKASFKKMSHSRWHIKARAIREIYEMNQVQYAAHVGRYRNHPNIYIRREAQIALVVFLGWESLRFLPYLKYPLMLWQQIKIVEKLHNLFPKPQVEYIKNANAIENDFGRELIMRIIRIYRLNDEIGYLISHLSSTSFDVRETAIYCLDSFKLNSEQLEDLKTIFPELHVFRQQKQVLKLIVNSSSGIDVPFFLDILHTAHDMLKLNVSEILWNNGYQNVVQQYYLNQYNNQKLEINA